MIELSWAGLLAGAGVALCHGLRRVQELQDVRFGVYLHSGRGWQYPPGTQLNVPSDPEKYRATLLVST